MKTLQWAAAALAVGALALPSGAETVTTNDWWDVRFESPTPTGVKLEIGELGALTNFDNQALGTDKPYLSGQWSMIDGDESYVTNEFNTVTTNGVTFGSDYCIKLDTQGNDLTWTPTNNPVNDITTLVDADLYLVGSDSPPDAGDFDQAGDVQTAIYLKNEINEESGETTNSVLCVYAYDANGDKTVDGKKGNYWQELEGVELDDNAWAHVQVSVDHSGDVAEIKVFVNGTQMHARGGTALQWTAANGSTSANAHKVSSVAFRGTGAVDNFSGKTLQTSFEEFDFTAEVYMNGSLVETGTGVNQTKVVRAQAGSDKSATFTGFSFHDFVAGEHATTFSLTKIELIDLSSGSASTYNYIYDNTAHQITPETPSENIVFATAIEYIEDEETGDMTEVEYQTGVFSILVPTAGATANATIAKIYFEDLPEEGTHNAIATTTVGETTTSDAKKVRPSEFAEGATKTITWEFPAVKDGNLLTTVQVSNGATLEYANKTATVTVTLDAVLAADTLFAAATYGTGSLAEGQDLKWTVENGLYTFTPYTPPVAIIVADSGATTNECATLAAAVAAVQDGETVVLVSTIANESVHYTGTAAFTIDLNGQTWNYLDGETGNRAAFKNNGATVTFKDSSESGTGKIYCNGDGFCIWSRTGSVVIESGSFVNNSHEDYAIYIGTDDANFVDGVPPTITITGGSFVNEDNAPYNNKPAWSRLVLNVMNSNATTRTLVKTELIQVSGGSYSWDPALGDDNMGGSFVAEGYKSVPDDTTGLYNVVPDVNMVEITFMNGAKTLYTTQIVENAAVAYVGETPEKEATAQFTYTFAGWSTTDGGEALESLPDATENATYYAVFTESVNQYKVEWIVDGVYTTNEWSYNAMPSYGANDPTKESTDATNFTFKAWNPEVVAVTGFASYTATWTETVRTYLITFKVGETTSTTNAPYGDTGYAPADPTAPEGKVFKGWAAEETPTTVLETLPAISGAATYVAVFDDDVIEPPKVDVGDDLLANDGAPMEFAADGKCTVRFRASATGVYVLLSSTTVNGTYVADEAASATKTVTDLEDNLVELTEGTAGTTKFFKIGWSAE